MLRCINHQIVSSNDLIIGIERHPVNATPLKQDINHHCLSMQALFPWEGWHWGWAPLDSHDIS